MIDCGFSNVDLLPRRKTPRSAGGMTWKVKAALARKKLRIQDVADRLGRAKSTVSEVLHGNHKGYALRPQIAALLGLSEESLAREIDKAKLSRQGMRK